MGTLYPGAPDTDTSLYVAKNSAETTLNSTIDNAVTSIAVANLVGYPADGFITIDAEVIKYASTTTGVNGTFNSCTRGADGTTAAGHSANAKVRCSPVADHHNVLKDAIKALEAKVGNNTNGATATTIDGRQIAPGTVPVLWDTQTPVGVGTFTFATLPSSWGTTVIIDWQARCDLAATAVGMGMRFNGDATAKYDYEKIFAGATALTSSESLTDNNITVGNITGATATAAYAGSGRIVVSNYNGAVFYKTAICTNFIATDNGTGNQTILHISGKWRTTATALTSILIFAGGGNFVTGSKFWLWVQ